MVRAALKEMTLLSAMSFVTELQSASYPVNSLQKLLPGSLNLPRQRPICSMFKTSSRTNFATLSPQNIIIYSRHLGGEVLLLQITIALLKLLIAYQSIRYKRLSHFYQMRIALMKN